YWHLVNVFGDVPLILSTNYKENALISRTNIITVYEQIKADLLQSRELLSAEYPSNGRFRANQYVAATLLARVCLYMEEWEEAAEHASEVINSKEYRLVEDLDGVFVANSTEAIWQLTMDGQIFNSIEGNRFVPVLTGTTLPTYPLTDRLVEAFEAGDDRQAHWVGSKVVNGV